MAKKSISKDTVDIAVLDQRLYDFEVTCKDFKSSILDTLKNISASNAEIVKSNTNILIKINTLETKQKIYITIFGAIAGLIGSHLPSVLKGAFILILSVGKYVGI